jgi:hypothetical protein
VEAQQKQLAGPAVFGVELRQHGKQGLIAQPVEPVNPLAR